MKKKLLFMFLLVLTFFMSITIISDGKQSNSNQISSYEISNRVIEAPTDEVRVQNQFVYTIDPWSSPFDDIYFGAGGGGISGSSSGNYGDGDYYITENSTQNSLSGVGKALGYLALGAATYGVSISLDNLMSNTKKASNPSTKGKDFDAFYYGKLTKAIDQVLSENPDSGWDEETLEKELLEAINYDGVKGEEAEKKFRKNDKKVVYLGKYIENNDNSYDKVAQRNNGIYFSTPNWDEITTSGKNPWVLNALFLTAMSIYGCDFCLINNPNKYLNYATCIRLDDSYYSNELQFIRLLGYTWLEEDLVSPYTFTMATKDDGGILID